MVSFQRHRLSLPFMYFSWPADDDNLVAAKCSLSEFNFLNDFSACMKFTYTSGFGYVWEVRYFRKSDYSALIVSNKRGI
jgi:hypothetical protein